MALIAAFLFYIWRQLLARKDLSAYENIGVFVVIWLNLYLDTFMAFYRALPFESLNKITLYISLVTFLVLIKIYNKEFEFSKEFKRLFASGKKNDPSNEGKELPISYQEFENLAKSVHINHKKAENSNRNLIILCLYALLSIFCLYSEVYVDLKKFQSFWEKSQILDFLNYPFFIYSLFKYIDKNNKNCFYQHSKGHINIASFLKKYYIGILFFMAIYDIKRPRNFVNQDWTQQYLTRIVYLLLFVHICWVFSNKERVYDKDAGKQKKIGVADEIVSNIKLPLLAYLFFLNDEVDRLVLCFFILPMVLRIFF